MPRWRGAGADKAKALRILEIGWRHQPVDEARRQRLFCAIGTAGQHHVHCRAHTSQADGSNRSAEAGVDSELHLGQAQAHLPSLAATR